MKENSPVSRTRKADLFVSVAHGGEVAAHEFKFGIELHIIGSHLEHAQVQVCDGGKTTAGDEQEGGL